MRKYFDVEDCLFFVLADIGSCDPQEPSRMWAILEALERLKILDSSWRSVTAYKDHKCIRGCSIQEDRTYFHKKFGSGGWSDRIKICARCMAMILYFKEVHHLPYRIHTHWDIENRKAVRMPETDT